MIKKVFINVLRYYHKYLSFDTGLLRVLFPIGACRFHPSCSQYMIDSVQRHGCFNGFLKGILRIMRCNQFFPGGCDPVVDKKEGAARCKS